MTTQNLSDNLTEEKLEEVMEDAQSHFWASVVSHFPEINTGDFSPEQAIAFDKVCKEAIKSWVENNR